MRKPSARLQIMAHLRCKECNLNVCGAGCWQLLHGFYDFGPGKGEVLPLPPPRGKHAAEKDDEDDDEDAADGGRGSERDEDDEADDAESQ